MLFYTIIVATVPFGFLGALMVYFVVYNEYSHHYTDKKTPRKIALGQATFALVMLLSIIAAIAIAFSVSPP